MRRSQQDYQKIKEQNTSCMEAGSESYSSESDSGSEDESYSDGSDMANWEEFVAENGSLFYIEYMPKDLTKINVEGKVEFLRNSLRVAKISSRRQQQVTQTKAATANLAEGKKETQAYLFSNIATDDDSCKTLELVITAADRYRFGRRSTAVESILGFHVVPFVDQPECLMVDSFVHDMPAFFQQGKHIPVGKGDWFKTLDDIEIRTSNIDELLLQFVEPTKVCLRFQCPVKKEKKNDLANGEGANDLKKIENFKKFSEMFEQLQNLSENSQSTADKGMIFGMLILPPECYQNDEHKNSLYFYPEDPINNFLYKARGSFLTLNAVLSEELKSEPSASKLAFENVQYFVFYRKLNGFLVLFAYPCSMVNLSEGNLRADELLTYIKLMFPNMTLDSFKDDEFRSLMLNFSEIQRVRLLSKLANKCIVTPLEDVLKQSKHLPLPKEAQLRIFDALSEMEAMDYRNWNDEPLHTHREFFIYGSVLYYDNFMLASQMPIDMRYNIEVIMRCRGIFDFINKHSTKEMYVWEEIALPETVGRYFLAICGRGHLLLAVILKLFTTPDIEEDGEKVVPSLFYIEEIQETLDHLVQCGIESLAMFWSVSNKRPETLDTVVIDDENLTAGKDTKKSDTATLIKHKLQVNSGQQASTSKDSNTYTQRSVVFDEDNQPGSSLGGSSVHSLTPSEDDSSKKRLLTSTTACNEASDDSGSDWENFMEENLLHCTGVGDIQLQTQVTESLWKEISNVVPVKISAGWQNSIYYYIYVDCSNNSVFCPLKSSKESFPYTAEMNKAFYRIHQVLQKSKLAKRDANRQSNSKELIAVKEHGMTLRVRDVKATNDNKCFEFTVVGRLFLSPPKEVYICHRADIPQNMVEMAFRLSFFSLG